MRKTDQPAGQAGFTARYHDYQTQIEQALPAFVGLTGDAPGRRVVEAALYSLLAGGKRIRPVLLLAVADLLGHPDADLMPFACAIEMIHTYSLIHDDLPCMDDDDLRRGRPTCHKAYGEAIAVLAGDYLLNRAYETLLAAIDPLRPETIEAARLIGRAAGSEGMIGGQDMDLAAEERKLQADELEMLHRLKTGALIAAPIEAAVVLAGARETSGRILSEYARAIGLAFQIRDDILDVTASRAELGKTTGKDERDGKSTYVTLYGLDGARTRLAASSAEAFAQLDSLRDQLDVSFLEGLTRYLLMREN